jgi:DNA-binding PadR family transcriptional regulator
MYVNLISQNMNQYIIRHKSSVEQMSEAFKKELVQRITRNLLDVQILRLIQTEPMWGYKIKKQAETRFGVKLRHGALYPLLNALEKESFVTSQKQQQGGRTRKVYTITKKGEEYLETYKHILKQQIKGLDVE